MPRRRTEWKRLWNRRCSTSLTFDMRMHFGFPVSTNEKGEKMTNRQKTTRRQRRTRTLHCGFVTEVLVTAAWDFDTVASLQSTKRRKASQMCVASNTPEFYLLCREFPRLLARYDEGWHTRDDLIRAQQPRDSAKQAPPGLRGSPVVPADTCDDDLGDIQNGAKGRRFTVASFILSRCCENTYTHTHTHAHIAANTNKHADADWDRLGQHPPAPNPFLPTGRTGDVGRTHAEPTVYVQEAACAPSFQTRCSATVIGSCCMTLLSNEQKQQTFSSKAVWLISLTGLSRNQTLFYWRLRFESNHKNPDQC